MKHCCPSAAWLPDFFFFYTSWPSEDQLHCPSPHPSICSFFQCFLSVKGVTAQFVDAHALILSVTCSPGKLLALILYLSAVATVRVLPAPTNCFISDQQKRDYLMNRRLNGCAQKVRNCTPLMHNSIRHYTAHVDIGRFVCHLCLPEAGATEYRC